MNYKAAFAIVGVFIGCGSNVIFLEYLVKDDPGSGNLITFSQFVFISIHGFIFTSKFGTVKPKIALWDYVVLVVMFFITNVCNNMAFDFNIPMPLHMIFRAGSLIANMIMGIIILKKTYTISKYVSVGMITLGIIISTIVSSSKPKTSCSDCDSGAAGVQSEETHFFFWTLGIALLTVALFISARMGIYQEWLYKRSGKHPQEALFYTHLMPLPGFLLVAGNIMEHMKIANESTPFEITTINVNVPILWLYLVGNVLTQYICISSVYVLTTECSSLTVTLVVTLRKFFSLLFSIWYFQNPFTIVHWFGTCLVFTGTLIFTEVPNKIAGTIIKKEGPKSKQKIQ